MCVCVHVCALVVCACTPVCVLVFVLQMCMYPDAWAFSINYKSADRGTFVMYPSFCKWHYLI